MHSRVLVKSINNLLLMASRVVTNSLLVRHFYHQNVASGGPLKDLRVLDLTRWVSYYYKNR